MRIAFLFLNDVFGVCMFIYLRCMIYVGIAQQTKSWINEPIETMAIIIKLYN